LPSQNLAFRSSWDAGLDQALARIEQLKNEGWNVDVERGTLTESQTERFIRHAETHGFETQRIPVAEWAGSPVQFVAYKPKQVGEETTIPPAQPEPKVKRTREITPEEMLEKFQREFPTSDQPDNGCVMSADRTAAFAAHNANPQGSGMQFPKIADDLEKNASASGIVKEADVRETFQRVKLAEFDKKKVVAIGNGGYSIQFVRKALKVFGKGKVKFYVKDANSPLAIKNQRGDRIIIAPKIGPHDPNEVVSVI